MYAVIVGSYACCDVASVGRPGLTDHCDNVSHPPLATQPQSSQSSALLSYGDGAGHDGPCAAKSTDFWDERLELIVPCDDECCAAVATDIGGGGSGLIDDCEDMSLPPLPPPLTLLTLLLSCGRLNDLCNDILERGDGGPGLIDHCDEISSPSSLSSSTVQLSYCGHNDLCSDMAEHGNDVKHDRLHVVVCRHR